MLSRNKKTDTGSIIIKPVTNEEHSEETKKLNNIRRKNYEEKDIIYNFGYTKEERIEPLKMLLLEKHNDDEIEKNYEFKNNDENNVFKLTFDKKEELEEKKETPIENIDNKKIRKKQKEPKTLILPKSQKEIEYYKEKDLFDEEIKDKYKDFNITKSQINYLENITNRRYYKHSSLYEQKIFEIKHPLLEYDYYKIKESDKYIYNYKKKKKLFNMLLKQRNIIDNIMIRKNNIYNKNINISNTNNNRIFRIKRNKSSINSIKLYKSEPKFLEKKIFKSFSTNNYYNRDNWEKRQFLSDKKKEYSALVLINERRLNEERKNNLRLIRRIKLNEKMNKLENLNSKYNLEDDNYDNYEKETHYKKINKLPKIRQKKIKDDDDEIINYKENNYTNSTNSFRKYRLKKADEKKIFKTVLKDNPQLEQLLNNHEIYKMKLENIKSHMK